MDNKLAVKSIPRLALIEAMTSSDSIQRKLCILAAQFKMEFKTEYGQRIFTSNEIPNENLKGSAIFVGNIPRSALEDIIIPLFSQAGKIAETRLMLENTGMSKGYCFITYQTIEAANKAIHEFHGYVINQRNICVYQSLNNCRLYLCNIPLSLGKEQLQDELCKRLYGVLTVVMHNTDSKHKQGAFVEFQTHRYAEVARNAMWPSKLILHGIHISVEWAKPDLISFNEHRSIFIKNLPGWASREFIVNFIGSLTHSSNTILNVFRKKGGDRAVIEFVSVSFAHHALNMLDGFNWSGNILQVAWFTQLKEARDENNFQQICDYYLTPRLPAPVDDETESEGSELMRNVNEVMATGIDSTDEDVDINQMFKLPQKVSCRENLQPKITQEAILSLPEPSTSHVNKQTVEKEKDLLLVDTSKRNSIAGPNPQQQISVVMNPSWNITDIKKQSSNDNFNNFKVVFIPNATQPHSQIMYSIPNTTQQHNLPLNITVTQKQNVPNNFNNAYLIVDDVQQNNPANITEQPKQKNTDANSQDSYVSNIEAEYAAFATHLKSVQKSILIQKLYNQTVVNQHLLNILRKSKAVIPMEPKTYSLFGPIENDISAAVNRYFKEQCDQMSDQYSECLSTDSESASETTYTDESGYTSETFMGQTNYTCDTNTNVCETECVCVNDEPAANSMAASSTTNTSTSLTTSSITSSTSANSTATNSTTTSSSLTSSSSNSSSPTSSMLTSFSPTSSTPTGSSPNSSSPTSSAAE